MAEKTSKYQKQYGFEYDTGEGKLHNNETDAFKHAFMQGVLYHRASRAAYETGKNVLSLEISPTITNTIGNTYSTGGGAYHELDNLMHGNPYNETNMDLWNNKVGRDIMSDMNKKLGNTVYNLKDEYVEDFLAKEIVNKMKNGELITSPKDKRQYWMKNTSDIIKKFKR